MASLNKVILIGHLTADPELKQTATGIPVTSFSIGVTRRFTRQGEQPQSDFINIVAWRSTAEFISKFFRKGNAIWYLRFHPDPQLYRSAGQQAVCDGGSSGRSDLCRAQVRCTGRVRAFTSVHAAGRPGTGLRQLLCERAEL